MGVIHWQYVGLRVNASYVKLNQTWLEYKIIVHCHSSFLEHSQDPLRVQSSFNLISICTWTVITSATLC